MNLSSGLGSVLVSPNLIIRLFIGDCSRCPNHRIYIVLGYIYHYHPSILLGHITVKYFLYKSFYNSSLLPGNWTRYSVLINQSTQTNEQPKPIKKDIKSAIALDLNGHLEQSPIKSLIMRLGETRTEPNPLLRFIWTSTAFRAYRPGIRN